MEVTLKQAGELIEKACPDMNKQQQTLNNELGESLLKEVKRYGKETDSVWQASYRL